jgi:ribosomal protein S18 acetylase RimI-like enzyme
MTDGGDMVRLVPMTEEEFGDYLEQEIREYAAENVRAGYWTEEEALERSRKAHEELLPNGIKTKDHLLYRIQIPESGEKVGAMWLNVSLDTPHPSGFIFDIILDEAQRGKGYGKQAMLALEEVAKGMGLESLALHVFTHNTTAMKLYEKLGYTVTSQNMVKRLQG